MDDVISQAHCFPKEKRSNMSSSHRDGPRGTHFRNTLRATYCRNTLRETHYEKHTNRKPVTHDRLMTAGKKLFIYE